MRTQKITFLLAGLLLSWGSILAKYSIEIGGNGTLTAIADGNTGPYQFEWRDSNSTDLNPNDRSVSELTNLSNGTYYVSIFNGYGCETVLEATLGLSVFLEGAFIATTNEMKTVLNTERRLLPGQTPVSPLAIPTPAGQPYNTAPWNYTGIEGAGWTNSDYDIDIVDWILVSVRTETTKTTEVEAKAGLLKKDGSVLFPKPFTNLSNITTAYIVIEHRNHLPIMTPVPVSISNSMLNHDFTSIDSYGGNDATPDVSFGFGQIQKNGKYMMLAGNFDQEGTSHDIVGPDKGIWFDNNGVFDSYNNGDANLDGDTNGSDKSLWFDNNGKSSSIPQ